MSGEPGVPGGESLTALLDAVVAFVCRFVVLADEQADAIALWVVHTYLLDAAHATPYLAVTSAVKRCGKTRLLEVLELVVERPWLTGRVSAAVLTRKVDSERPTLLLDESDAALSGRDEYAEALRGLLNSGHRPSGTSSLCIREGTGWSFRDFSTFGAKCVAGIGCLPDTVADRSVPIRLERKSVGEIVERFRRRNAELQAATIRLVAAQAATAERIERLSQAEPSLPIQLGDRASDCWEPLLAIADEAGPLWARRATRAALTLSATEDVVGDVGTRLLDAIRRVWDATPDDRIATRDLLRGLADDDTGPWSDWWDHARGEPARGAPRRLAELLRAFNIRSRTVDWPCVSAKGYLREQFSDAFTRYGTVQRTVESVDTGVSHKNGASPASPQASKGEVLGRSARLNSTGSAGISTDSTDSTGGEALSLLEWRARP